MVGRENTSRRMDVQLYIYMYCQILDTFLKVVVPELIMVTITWLL